MGDKLPQKVLQAGEKAPYTGVLVPEDLYRTFQVADLESNIMRQRAFECQNELNDIKPEPNWIQPIWFIGGLMMGAFMFGKAK